MARESASSKPAQASYATNPRSDFQPRISTGRQQISSIKQFSPTTVEAIESYVYVLTDKHDRIFYVGKGKGDRVFSHVDEVRELSAKSAALSDASADAGDSATADDSGLMGPKRGQIAKMLQQGLEPAKYIVRHGLTSDVCPARRHRASGRPG